MDAANYITTLDRIASRRGRPTDASYAIIDLAVDHEFLREMYNAMSWERVEWWSLFEGRKWQQSWSNGPILVDLKRSSAFVDEVISMMENRSLGVLIQTALGAGELLQHCRRLLLGPEESGERLLRFYEPRMLGPLLCVLDDAQRQHIAPPTEEWSWHDGLVWRYSPQKQKSWGSVSNGRIFISDDRLQQLTPYRLAAESWGLADYYQDKLTEHPEPTTWVLTRLLEAHEVGISRLSDQERWLRLAIRHGDFFPSAARFQDVWDQEQRTVSERLTALESLRKNDDVPTV